MIVRCSINDSMTGEDEVIELVVSEFTGEAIRQAFEAHAQEQCGEVEQFALESFVLHKSMKTAAFILRHVGRGYDAGYLLVGIAYTQFS